MKQKILTLTIGILIGVILATGVFFIYSKINSNSKEQGRMNGERGQMMNGQRVQNGEIPNGIPDGNIPEKLTEDNTNTQNTLNT